MIRVRNAARAEARGSLLPRRIAKCSEARGSLFAELRGVAFVHGAVGVVAGARGSFMPPGGGGAGFLKASTQTL